MKSKRWGFAQKTKARAEIWKISHVAAVRGLRLSALGALPTLLHMGRLFI